MFDIIQSILTFLIVALAFGLIVTQYQKQQQQNARQVDEKLPPETEKEKRQQQRVCIAKNDILFYENLLKEYQNQLNEINQKIIYFEKSNNSKKLQQAERQKITTLKQIHTTEKKLTQSHFILDLLGNDY